MKEKEPVEIPNMVWAFAQADPETKPLLVQSLKNGKSRFGWSSADEHHIMNGKSEHHRKHRFLKEIKKGDWIVHINTPKYGQCMAAKVISEYQFDEGLNYNSNRTDFRHCFEVDPETVIEFNRRDVHPKVNLKPRGRYHRVYATKEFAESIENITNGGLELKAGKRKEDYFLRKETEEKILPQLTKFIQQMNKGKELEKFLADCFNNVPYVEVKKNGFGPKTDNGADLLLNISDAMGISDYLAVVQVKSYKGEVVDKTAINDIKKAFNEFRPEVGIIMTTGVPTEDFIASVDKLTEELQKEELLNEDKNIITIAGNEFARFVLKYAPEKLFEPFRL